MGNRPLPIANLQAWWVHVPIPERQQHFGDFGQVSSFDSTIVRVTAENGVVGWGEAKNAPGSAGTYAALTALLNQEIAPKLIGKNALAPSVLADELYSGVRAHFASARGFVFPEMSRRGMSVAAISAVDIALWDLLGKTLDAPVWQLLGGRRAERLPAYGSGGWASAADIGPELRDYVDRGKFGAVKMRIGPMDGSMQESARRVIAAREAIGPDVELLVDAHGAFTLAEAKRFCHLVRDCDLGWLEEPLSGDDKPGMARLREFTHVPIAAGESEYTRFDFRDMIDAGAVDVLQPDLAVCGGITEGMRIAALASAHNLRMAPHLWSGAPGFTAGMHIAAASNCGYILEYSLGGHPMLHDLVEEEFVARDGYLDIPDRPGLGITIREDYLQAHVVSGEPAVGR
ncbi:L-alanine-DL-glutamate epimerase-like enolase superfamily enzyme [Tamaricihabitans halophyticus]|uniref:L-alanine-DL-glutamate epimerase-like enolase superfamily enzyme n=1 Tax=Tamaricihabitans halophyticus TaxID=1262583 RepID=A0A4R2QLE9_9PSEU|nr:mandelate racemase/muconate lactonizing enzyme family protein [Tamaricihabitans halophyticus]TCP47825.1 L-alanine-DL-glutamate epimerase-like enolase superfamily enzyme [Tamaricihabitans halophyticus]